MVSNIIFNLKMNGLLVLVLVSGFYCYYFILLFYYY